MTQKPPALRASSRSERIITFLGSTKFFWIVGAIFVFQALWIALTARYPEAFDEQFHFGIINIYSHHLSPFLSSRPTSADQFGAIASDPSYLYQYLLSFPLRLIRLFTNDLTIQVIWLRLLNIALLGSSLVIFRKLFRALKVSDALSHVLLFCFVLTPVVPLLAAQINYDNMVVPLSALAVYWTVRFSQQVRATKSWSWTAVCQLLILCLLASIVKYAFIPIFAGIAIWVFIDWSWLRRQERPKRPVTELSPRRHYLRIVGYGLLLVIAATLFTQRYGLNMVRYHTPTPECDQVLSIARCQAYGPWARNYMYNQQSIHLPLNQVLTYPGVWVYHALNELIFTVTGRFNDHGTVDYYAGSQLIVIEVLAWTILTLGVLAVLYFGRQLARHRELRLLALVIFLYVAALGGQNYLDYLHLGYPVAIHGRYLLPILPLIYLLVALAFRSALQRLPLGKIRLPVRKLSVSGFVLLVLLLEGGGFVTYIMRSDSYWSWPQSQAAQNVNDKARKLLKPIIIDTGN